MLVSLLGPQIEAPVLISTGQDPVLESHVHIDTSAISAGVPTLGGTVAPPPTLHEADTTAKIPNPVHLVNLSTAGKYYPLPTPVNVNSLEKVLDGHPDRTLVNQLCHNLRHGACIGYTGPRVPRFCKNLPTALAQPDIVTSNLAKEVALGRIAGPYDSPPFPNFHVSPIGLVPKNIQANLEPFFTCHSRSQGQLVLIILFQRRTTASNTLQLTMQSKAFKALGKDVSLPRLISNPPFGSYLSNPKITNCLVSVGKASFTMKKFYLSA